MKKVEANRDLVLMTDVFCACIESGVLPKIESPCHFLARRLVAESGFKFKRKRFEFLKVHPISAGKKVV